MSNLADLASIAPLVVWPDVQARRVEGQELTFAVVELGPNALVPEHRHPNEQIGMVINGQVRFTVGDETRDLRSGGTWRILANVPHIVEAGPDGAVVVDVFSPIRSDWGLLTEIEPRRPLWPDSD